MWDHFDTIGENYPESLMDSNCRDLGDGRDHDDREDVGKGSHVVHHVSDCGIVSLVSDL